MVSMTYCESYRRFAGESGSRLNATTLILMGQSVSGLASVTLDTWYAAIAGVVLASLFGVAFSTTVSIPPTPEVPGFPWDGNSCSVEWGAFRRGLSGHHQML
jgi:hypothetical protein